MTDLNTLTTAVITALYNTVPGIRPVKKFETKTMAIARLNAALGTNYCVNFDADGNVNVVSIHADPGANLTAADYARAHGMNPKVLRARLRRIATKRTDVALTADRWVVTPAIAAALAA